LGVPYPTEKEMDSIEDEIAEDVEGAHSGGRQEEAK
jgi:hypothetical protein